MSSVWACGWLSLWVPDLVTCSILILSCRMAAAVALHVNWTALRSALFSVITQREVVISYRRFGQPIGPFFMGQESENFVVIGFYDFHNKFYTFIYISVKGTTWKQIYMGNLPTTTNTTAPSCVWNVTKNYIDKFQNYWLFKQTSGKPEKYKPLENNVLYCLVTDSGLLQIRERMTLGLINMLQLWNYLRVVNESLSIPFGDDFCILLLQVPSVCIGLQGRSVPHSPGVQEERSLPVSSPIAALYYVHTVCDPVDILHW